MTFDGKTVIVTGAGSGLGWAVAHRFVEAGARVLAVDRYADRLDAFVEAHPGAEPVEADLATIAGADKVFAAVGDHLDVLVNNAGILDGLAFVDDLTEDEWDQVMAVNLRGPWALIKRAVPLMTRAGGGVIVNVASVAGLRGARGGAAYTASKWGLIGLTYNVAASLRDRGIRCNAICPGSMLTRIGEGQDIRENGWELVNRTEKVEAVDPDVVAAVVMFAASEEARHLNGVALPVDGGSIAS